MIRLPNTARPWARLRVVTSDRWDNGWKVMAGPGPRTSGIEVLSLSRVALPAVGEAELRFRYGWIDGRIFAPGPGTGQSGTWTPDLDQLAVPDLKDTEIRIQMAVGATWRTIWWGRCVFQEDRDWPGSALPAGERRYHCVDVFARTKDWPINRHGFASGATVRGPCVGHPGYNVDAKDAARALAQKYNWDSSAGATLLGNRHATATFVPNPDTPTVTARCHTWEGSADAVPWTDDDVITHLLRELRPGSEPDLSPALPIPALAAASAWPVTEDQSVFDLCSRILRRQRGLGVFFVSWPDDDADPLAPLVPALTWRPQIAATLSGTLPSGGPYTVTGAISQGSDIAVDLIGDHRLVDGSFVLGDRDSVTVDYLESVGERIQVVATLRGEASELSLDKRWTATDETAFAAITDPLKRTSERWRPVWQAAGLPWAWNFLAVDGDGGSQVGPHCIAYRCDDTGEIANDGGPVAGSVVTSPYLCTFLPDTPLLDGYVYNGAAPARRDGSSEAGTPIRRPPEFYIRTGANRYLTLGRDTEHDRIGEGFSVQANGPTLRWDIGGDTGQGTRYLAGTANPNLGGRFDWTDLVATVAIELPNRVRIASGDPTSRRRRVITHPGWHLWLASPGAIWDLDATSRSTLPTAPGCTALRSACGATTTDPGILRDDRDRLAIAHHLAWAWYGTPRRTAQWAMRDLGFGTFDVVDENGDPATPIAYPQLGDCVTTILGAGQQHQIGTPVTSITYDHQTGTTTWATDWSELDFNP